MFLTVLHPLRDTSEKAVNDTRFTLSLVLWVNSCSLTFILSLLHSFLTSLFVLINAAFPIGAKLKRLSVHVVVDEEEVAEIIEEEAGSRKRSTNKVTRYIQVEEGIHFGIKISVDERFVLKNATGLESKIFLDGVERNSSVFEKDDELKNGSCEETFDAFTFRKSGQWHAQKFCFSDLQQGNFQTPIAFR